MHGEGGRGEGRLTSNSHPNSPNFPTRCKTDNIQAKRQRPIYTQHPALLQRHLMRAKTPHPVQLPRHPCVPHTLYECKRGHASEKRERVEG